jgi:hypothetical protein
MKFFLAGASGEKIVAGVIPVYHWRWRSVMHSQVVIEEQEMPLDLGRLFEQARRNLLWFNENAERLDVFNRYRGRYVAAAGGELFVGASREEVERLARAKYPNETPHIRRIPAEKRAWIYAGQR